MTPLSTRFVLFPALCTATLLWATLASGQSPNEPEDASGEEGERTQEGSVAEGVPDVPAAEQEGGPSDIDSDRDEPSPDGGETHEARDAADGSAEGPGEADPDLGVAPHQDSVSAEERVAEDDVVPARYDPDGIFGGLDHTGTPELPALEADDNAGTGAWTGSYDGREEAPTRPEDVLVWIPRGLLLPVHLVLEYVLRRPFVAFLSWAEENHVFERIVDFFTFADGDGTVFPSVFVVSGRGVQFGLNLNLNNVGTEGHTVSAAAQYGTGGFYNFSLTDELRLFENDAGTLRLHGQFGEDPTFAFYGVGPDQPISNEVFFGVRRGEVRADLDIAFADLNRIRFNLGWRNVQFVGGQNPSIDAPDSPFFSAVQNGELVGFENPYNIFSIGTGFDLDTRSSDREFTTGTGVRLEGFASFNFVVGDPEIRYLRYGFQPSVFVDITGVNHVLEISARAEAMTNNQENLIPINELVTVGGNDNLRGFLVGRSRGQSALSLKVDYSWPVFFFLDGVLFWEIGNAFHGFYDDFGFGNMLTAFGFGFRTSMSRESAIDILFAWGTNRINQWDDDFEVDTFRFILGVANFQ